MDITYTMIGADGLQYGPITLEQLKGWIAEGRVTGDTKILRSDTNAWLPAANYSELGVAQTVAAPAPIAPIAPPVAGAANPRQAGFDPVLVRQFHRGASWFYWIAALSFLNTILAMSGTGFSFLFGHLGISWRINNPVASIVIAGIFALFGFLATKGQTWAFIVGIILYLADALVFLNYSIWIELAFHAYVLFRLVMGVKSLIQLKSSAR